MMEAWTAKEIREYTAMTQAEFSAYSGIPTRSIEQWETGKRTPPEYVLRLLQRAVIEDANSGRLLGKDDVWKGSVSEPITIGGKKKQEKTTQTEEKGKRKIKAVPKEFETEIEIPGLKEPYKEKEIRFVLVDAETGEIVDDAQGYGYKTAQGAHKAYGWKKGNKKRK